MKEKAIYRNHHHYIKEGWSAEPKEFFKSILEILVDRKKPLVSNIIDVGCATGEFINFLKNNMPNTEFVGVDIAEELLVEARERLPDEKFIRLSALELDTDIGQFDTVLALGCMSIFDDDELEIFWSNLVKICKPGGLIIVFSPLNKFGVDALIKHRKRTDAQLGSWEKGWNIYSIETVTDILASLKLSLETRRFRLPFNMEKGTDPIRTWTIETEYDQFQLTNGLQLLVEHYFMIVDVPKNYLSR